MKLQEILQSIKYLTIHGDMDQEVTTVCIDSRKCKEGSLYIAMKGTASDGHDFIRNAISSGASVVIGEQDLGLGHGVTYIQVKDSRETAGLVASAFYGFPSQKLKLVGITGTNGKTSTVSLLHEMFQKLGKKSALLSTVVNKIGEETIPSTHTTPDVVSFHELLSKAVEQDCEYVFMEVSSHGIDQKRIAGAEFSVAGFTNITRDHLDYHQTFDQYRDAKKKFFDDLPKSAIAITNIDDKNGAFMLQNTSAEKKTYALKTLADYHAKILESDFNGMLLNINSKEVYTSLTGVFNAYNLLLVYGIGLSLEVEENEMLKAISQAGRVKGRFETQKSESGIFVIVDYAHTPDALENILTSINALRKNTQRLITIIGCGGDRDAGKRPMMADISTKYSTVSIFTSDNPRTEDPKKILADMEAGVGAEKKSAYTVIEDRKEAIRSAVKFAEPGDIILIAGKGHETYQELQGVKHDFDDASIVKELLIQAGK